MMTVPLRRLWPPGAVASIKGAQLYLILVYDGGCCWAIHWLLDLLSSSHQCIIIISIVVVAIIIIIIIIIIISSSSSVMMRSSIAWQ